MESRYIKLDHNEALSAKKQLLYLQIDLLNSLKKLNEYRNFRKKEFILKNQLKSGIFLLKNKISLFQSTLPEESENKIKIKPDKKEIREKKNIQNELEDIKAKLARLK